MPARKRGRAEMEAAEPPPPPSLLTQIRNRWEFANLMQFILIFGDALKIDSEIDVEDLENELMRSEPSEKLVDIGLCFLKSISPSNRYLTPDTFDQFAKKVYHRNDLDHRSPFGGPRDEPPTNNFHDFDAFTKIRVLWQLSQLTLKNPLHIREIMDAEEKKEDQTYWRIEEVGFDKDGRPYFVLDDNRLYRRTDPPPVEPIRKPKANSKAGRALARANKRRKTNARKEADEEGEEVDDADQAKDAEEDLFGGMKWECIAVSKSDYDQFTDKLRRSKNADEKALVEFIDENVIPLLLEAEEKRQRKIQQREKELRIQEKMHHAKRSSRIANKQEKEREAAEAAAAERKKQEVLADYRKNIVKEKEREKRILTREQRIKEREAKRILEEEGIRELSEAQEKGETRMSARAAQVQIEKKRKEIEALDEEDWMFDCSGCGKHGQNLDDGSHSVSCEKCNVWQHSKCLGISEAEAEKEDFHFVCADCKRKEEDAKKPKIPPLKLKASSSISPPSNKNKKVKLSSDTIEVRVPKKSDDPSDSIILDGKYTKRPSTHVPIATSSSPMASSHPAPNSHYSQFSPPAPSSYTSSNTAAYLHNGAVQQAAFPKASPPTYAAPKAYHQHHVPSTASAPAFSNSAAHNLNGAYQASLPKPAPGLPPIGHFAPLSRTHSTSISTSASTPPPTKLEPPPAAARPSLPAYTSPWTQPNGSSEPKPYFSPPQPKSYPNPPGQAYPQPQASTPLTNGVNSSVSVNGSMPNGSPSHNGSS